MQKSNTADSIDFNDKIEFANDKTEKKALKKEKTTRKKTSPPKKKSHSNAPPPATNSKSNGCSILFAILVAIAFVAIVIIIRFSRSNNVPDDEFMGVDTTVYIEQAEGSSESAIHDTGIESRWIPEESANDNITEVTETEETLSGEDVSAKWEIIEQTIDSLFETIENNI